MTCVQAKIGAHMQTPFEIIDNLMRGKPAERVGFTDSPWDFTVETWVEEGYTTDDEGKPINYVDYFDFDISKSLGGFTEPLLDLVVDAGFDGVNPMEVKARNDPLRIAENYGDKLALIGGLDALVLESGDRDLIRTEVTKLVQSMKERGARYVFASDHSVSTNVRLPDFEYAIEVYRENMMY